VERHRSVKSAWRGEKKAGKTKIWGKTYGGEAVQGGTESEGKTKKVRRERAENKVLVSRD
jgi:hypothetical protein